MSVIQSDLPYKENALEPHISRETLFYHYEKHHRGYVDKLNGLIKDTPYDALELEQILAKARKNGDIGILNNALQAWNHGFLWHRGRSGRRSTRHSATSNASRRNSNPPHSGSSAAAGPGSCGIAATCG